MTNKLKIDSNFSYNYARFPIFQYPIFIQFCIFHKQIPMASEIPKQYKPNFVLFQTGHRHIVIIKGWNPEMS